MKLVNLKLYYYDENFKQAIVTPKITLRHRKALIIELTTDNNQRFYGECNAFETDWYFDETIAVVIGKVKEWFQNVRDMTLNSFEDIKLTLKGLDKYPATRSTIIMACFQMFNKLEALSVSYGATVSGLNNIKYKQLAETRPERIKVKWSTNILQDLEHLMLLPFRFDVAIDANESLSLNDISLLEQVSTYNIIYIEEPFKSLQTIDKTAITHILNVALDEKALSLATIEDIIKEYDIRVVVLKPFRLGGIDKVLDAIDRLSQLGVRTVIGGMYEYGLSRYFTAMLAQYATYTSDITPEGFYFAHDFAENMGIVKNGRLLFHPPHINASKLTAIY